MNDLLSDLAKKAGINLSGAQFSGVLEAEVSEFDLEAFAKLIVQECFKSAMIEFKGHIHPQVLLDSMYKRLEIDNEP